MMNRMLLGSIGFFLISYAFADNEAIITGNPESSLLPSPYPVYVIENSGVVNHSYPGAVQVFIPTNNEYKEAPGCYIACYSHQPGAYAVSSNIYVIGQVRVRGHYVARNCVPEGYKNMDISKADPLKELCSVSIEACKNKGCWAGGDTGGWFGIQ